MTLLQDVQAKFLQDEFEFSKHAVDQSVLRDISVIEIREALACGEIIKDCPDDKYEPSCLIFGMTVSQRPLHIQCSYPIRPIIKSITVYEPNPTEWIDYKERQ
jgi:hypothetical protein